MAGQRGAAAAGEQPEPVGEPVGDLADRAAPGSAPRRARWRAAGRRGGGRSRRPAASVDSSRTSPERTAEARSTNSCTAAYDIASSSPTSHGGRPSGGRTQSDSPSTPSGSRLVASTRSSGHEARRSSTSRAVASSRCSQLSTTSRNGPALSVATSSEKSSVPRRASRVRSRTIASRRSRAREEGGQHAALVADRRELDQRRAAPVGGLPRPADLGGQAGLAGAARADHRRQPAAAEHVRGPAPAPPPGRGSWSAPRAGRAGAPMGVAAGDVLAQQRHVELAQRRGRVGAEGVGQGGPEPLVRGEGLGGAAGRRRGRASAGRSAARATGSRG